MAISISSINNNNNKSFEKFIVVWLDSNPSDILESEQNLRLITNDFKKFQDLQQCQQYIQQTLSKDQLILIVNSQLGRHLLPSIHHLEQIISIYIYYIDTELSKQYFLKYSKVKSVLTNVNELISKVTYYLKIRRKIEEPFKINVFISDEKSTTRLNGQFVFFQVLIECLLKLRSTDLDKNELITLCQTEYQRNKTELDILKEFQRNYSSENALRWYTRESFFYRTINTALRSENIHMMFLLRSYIFDIQQKLQQYQYKDHLKVYRSQIMSKNEFEIFKQSEGQLISVNSFFSTSKDRSLTVHILGETNYSVNWERILFEIDVNPELTKIKPFADISQFSHFPDESEVLFMTGSVFRVEKISINENQVWIVQMTLNNDNEHDFKDILKDMKKQIGKGNTNLRILGKILWEIGELHLAEKYFERFLSQLSSDDPLHIDLYDDLAKLTAQMKYPDISMEWRQKLILFKKNNPFSCSNILTGNILHIQMIDLDIGNEIGYGGFGTVYRAKWLPTDITVAVKISHPTHINDEIKQIFHNELSILNCVRHPNIINIYGSCLQKDRYALIMEYMSLGSLYQFLHKDKINLLWSDRLLIAIQAARGIQYLHQYQPSILHRDIKSLNFLLEKHYEEYFVKVCDFGMAKTRNETTRQATEHTKIGFTLSWAAPEILCMKTYTDKSDIYSLSIVYWELASYRIPYDGHENSVIREFVLAGKRLDIPNSIPSSFYNIINKCWVHEPENRPNCSDLLKMLNDSIENQSNNHEIHSTTTSTEISSSTNLQEKIQCKTNILESNLKWKTHAKTIAGGKNKGNQLNQLNCPKGIYVDREEKSIYIADSNNHRIVKWKFDESNGKIVAGGNGNGRRIDQLSCPTDVIVDKINKSLIICDWGNRRVVRWSIEKPYKNEIIISDIGCYGLTMNDKGDLFVSDCWANEVKRWRKGEKDGTIVAGGNERGDRVDQLDWPTFLFIDREENVYVSDCDNHRVMKWYQDASEGIVIAGGHGRGNSLKQLSKPMGLIVNEEGDVYVADSWNHRIMFWSSKSQEGRIVLDINYQEQGSNHLDYLNGLSVDNENNLYIVDHVNNRIQRYDVDNEEKLQIEKKISTRSVLNKRFRFNKHESNS